MFATGKILQVVDEDLAQAKCDRLAGYSFARESATFHEEEVEPTACFPEEAKLDALRETGHETMKPLILAFSSA